MSAAEADSYDDATGATEQTVELETVEAVTANTTDTFSPVVDPDVISAVSKDYGKPVVTLPYTAASTTTTWAASTTEKRSLRLGSTSLKSCRCK